MTDLREVRGVETYPLFFSGELAENEFGELADRESRSGCSCGKCGGGKTGRCTRTGRWWKACGRRGGHGSGWWHI